MWRCWKCMKMSWIQSALPWVVTCHGTEVPLLVLEVSCWLVFSCRHSGTSIPKSLFVLVVRVSITLVCMYFHSVQAAQVMQDQSFLEALQPCEPHAHLYWKQLHLSAHNLPIVRTDYRGTPHGYMQKGDPCGSLRRKLSFPCHVPYVVTLWHF